MRPGGRPTTWSGSYGRSVGRGQQQAADRPCPNGCGHPRGEHRERPRTLQAVSVPGGCGQPHTCSETPLTCGPCTAALPGARTFDLVDVPNPAFEAALIAYCQRPGCDCQMTAGAR